MHFQILFAHKRAQESTSSVADKVRDWTTTDLGFDFQQGRKFTTQTWSMAHNIKIVLKFCRRSKRSYREGNHSPRPSVEITNASRHTAAPSA
jgi:hypothetical protein